MTEVVLVDAVRTPFGKRQGGLAGLHSFQLLGTALRALVDRTQVDPASIGQVLGGSVSQVGMQAMNVTRGAWLTAGLPSSVAASTVDAQCGSSQQAFTVAYALIGSGIVDSAIACGVESMSVVPIGSNVPADGSLGKPITRDYWKFHEATTQFEAAERMAQRWGISRANCDELGKLSQDRAAAAVAGGHFDSQLIPVSVPAARTDDAEEGTAVISRDEGIRPTSREGLAALKPTSRSDGVHTAGTSSQISDGASAALLMSRQRAADLGLQPIATVVDSCLVGTDPTLMLTGPIAVTNLLLERQRMRLAEFDVIEINEAFASVVLSWEREVHADMARVNPNGGAIALGHPMGATGVALIAKAAHELIRRGDEHALVTMCCGGGLGTGTILRRAS